MGERGRERVLWQPWPYCGGKWISSLVTFTFHCFCAVGVSPGKERVYHHLAQGLNECRNDLKSTPAQSSCNDKLAARRAHWQECADTRRHGSLHLNCPLRGSTDSSSLMQKYLQHPWGKWGEIWQTNLNMSNLEACRRESHKRKNAKYQGFLEEQWFTELESRHLDEVACRAPAGLFSSGSIWARVGHWRTSITPVGVLSVTWMKKYDAVRPGNPW